MLLIDNFGMNGWMNVVCVSVCAGVFYHLAHR